MGGPKPGHHEILERLGKGGIGEVYRARDEGPGREVALELLPADSSSDEKRVTRFQREAKLASQPSHPNIAIERGHGGWKDPTRDEDGGR